MQNVSDVTIEGFVTHDPIAKKTKTGKSVCTFSLAVNHFSSVDDEPRVSYFDIETWEKIADICSDNVSKGRRLMVLGSLRQERWEGQDGKRQSRIKIVAQEVRFIESLKSLAGHEDKQELRKAAV